MAGQHQDEEEVAPSIPCKASHPVQDCGKEEGGQQGDGQGVDGHAEHVGWGIVEPRVQLAAGCAPANKDGWDLCKGGKGHCGQGKDAQTDLFHKLVHA